MTERSINIIVVGTPQPQGSTKAFVVGKRAVITSDNTRLKPWRERMVYEASTAVEETGWDTATGPVEVLLKFRLPKPKTVRRDWPTVRPDIDKLARAVLDSLTVAAVFKDDSQVIALGVTKAYSCSLMPPGVTITVTEREQP